MDKETIDKILFKLRKIDNQTDQKMSSYIEEKIKRDNNLIELTDNLFQKTESRKFLLSNDQFIERNSRIKDRLAIIYDDIAKNINKCQFQAKTTEGYAKAEVTLGGVDTNEISPITFECKKVKNMHFIGEVLDVTGHLGGYNFQWAWSSGYVAGQNT